MHYPSCHESQAKHLVDAAYWLRSFILMGKHCLRPTVENIEVTYTRLMRHDAVIVLTCSLPNFVKKKYVLG